VLSEKATVDRSFTVVVVRTSKYIQTFEIG